MRKPTPCPKCGGAVRVSTSTCSDCHHRIKSGGKSFLKWTSIFIAGFFGLVILGKINETPKTPAMIAAAEAAEAEADERERKMKIAENESCRQDVVCFASKYLAEAMAYCERPIENLATYDFEWLDGWMFTRYRWSDREAGIVEYIGDKVKFQNGFGAWQNVKYSCVLDTRTNKVLNAFGEAGRIR